MPHSRHRHKNPSHQQQHSITTHKPKRNAATVMAIIIGVFGVIVGAISSESNFIWMALGAVAGAIAGYLIGRGMDKAASKK